MAKKNATMSQVTDLFVKLSNLYGDVYLVKNAFVISGKTPSERILGPVMCTLEAKYRDALKEIIGEEPCFYIPDIVEAKKWFQAMVEKIKQSPEKESEIMDEVNEQYKQHIIKQDDKKIIESCVHRISEFEDRFNPVDPISYEHPVRWWSCLGENAELINTVFNLKGIFDLPIEFKPTHENTDGENEPIDTKTYITIAKQLLPMVTEKNINNAYLGTTGIRHGEDDELLEVMLDFRFTHFRMMIIYNLVILPWAEVYTESL